MLPSDKDIDTSDIPEADEAWFKRATLRTFERSALMTGKEKEVEKVERASYDEAAPRETLPSQTEVVPPVETPAPDQPVAVPVPPEGAEPYPPETASEAAPVSTEAPVNEGTAPVEAPAARSGPDDEDEELPDDDGDDAPPVDDDE